MTKTIAFFHRNSFHKDLFVKVGKILRERNELEILHIRELGDMKGERVFQYEKSIEKKWNDIDISYSNLCNLEKEYPDSNLMRALYSEREYNFFPKYYSLKPVSYEEQLKYLVGCFCVFEECIEQNNVDCVISDLPTGLPDVLHAICQKKGVQYISIRSSKLLTGFVLCDQHHDLPTGMIDVYKKFLQNGIPDKYYELAKSHVNELKSKITTPSYMEVTGKPFKMLRMRRIYTMISMLRESRNQINKISRARHPVRNSILWNIHRFINIWQTKLNKSRWFCKELPLGEKFFVFPLQYEPEASTFVRAFPFFDQMYVIQQIAKALPLGVTLIVKEHKGNQGYRKSAFYRELQYLPNVKLVDRETELNNLISNSIGIITLTSRMGWEGLVFRKPVIALGSTFYTFFEEVKKPGAWMELKRIIEECVSNMDNDNKESDYDKKLLAYAAAYISLIQKGNYIPGSMGVFDGENISAVAKVLNEQIVI